MSSSSSSSDEEELGFRMLTQDEEIPDGWRLASLHDTSKYEEEAREAITLEWGICTLVDGKIGGPGYKFEVETGSFFDLGHKLVTNKGSGWFVIKSKHSDFVLDIEEGKHGANIITYKQHGGDNQLWKWKGRTIVSKLGHVLDVKDCNAEEGTNIIAWKRHCGPNQQWKMKGDKIISELNDMALDINGESKDSNINIIAWPLKSETEVDNQSWELEYE